MFVARFNGGVDGDDAGAVQQAFAQVLELFAVIAQHVVGVHQHRLFGGLVGDKRVAVAVAANPRAKAQQRRQHHFFQFGVDVVQRAAQVAVNLRDGLKEADVKVVQAVVDFVVNQRFARAHFVG